MNFGHSCQTIESANWVGVNLFFRPQQNTFTVKEKTTHKITKCDFNVRLLKYHTSQKNGTVYNACVPAIAVNGERE